MRSPPSHLASPENVMLTLTCPRCSRALQIDEASADQATCPDCGQIVPLSGRATTVLDADSPNASPCAVHSEQAGVGASGLEYADSIVSTSEQDTIAIAPRNKRDETTTELLEFLAPPRQPGDLGWLGPYRVFKILGAGGM